MLDNGFMLPDCYYSIRLINKLVMLDKHNKLGLDQIKKSIYWAKKYHSDQKRKSGEPYYTHPLEVAYIVSDYLLQTDVIIAAILHDIVEDTEVTAEMIRDAFDARTEQIVNRLTRDRPDGTKLSVAQILNNAYEHDDKEVLLIKVVDRLHNMQTVGAKSPNKIQETIEEFIIPALYLENAKITQELTKLCYENTDIISALQDDYSVPLLENSRLLSQAFQNASIQTKILNLLEAK
ncbi:MAG: HD domain-containing protein [Rickettsiaceae bacterium]